MYKYQEALDYISSFLSQVRGRGNGKSKSFIKLAESLIALQELIDETTHVKNPYGRLWFLESRLDQVERALDMACYDLARRNRPELLSGCAKDYKEHYLKESENKHD